MSDSESNVLVYSTIRRTVQALIYAIVTFTYKGRVLFSAEKCFAPKEKDARFRRF
jgi:hypothetical protein